MGQREESSRDAGLTKPWPKTGSSDIGSTRLDGSSLAFTLASHTVTGCAILQEVHDLG